ncbi:[citrate (pro-3S)-lyase] ligase [Yersinia rohdei]|uniref:[Citrate [pro-3S]-lyase] ligase n=1 Tax=Yersinia rohdei TaxID=29485 RepID=A0A0U1HSB4_YERRO|nr:[citrate (pro-3S)-lyase] ligase [Yersinia rohdei]AJJ11393.1 [citrate (pro-3S)-lyase] ligase [Yersinia rohdei]EEQ01134.1 [Citrate [pro-3S]-lyase] ligase [Yersinia rohdei ATCC 43380]MDN0096511.1 [citrate (pro-3S)-lyase] ligase [Yersinia rohdei]CND86544.1 [citrate [pro-3s]-lyase] ligase [Yersinia rohdei]CQI89731.1 [citrate [pro-3s]-lyase] ligase [Yersinia rohdei]
MDAVFNRVNRSDHQKIAEITGFLRENDLNIDTTVEVFITVNLNEKLVACGGIAGNIIKCVAISEQVRGEGLALILATELVNLAYERHHSHLFIYTKTKNENLFKACGFYPIASVPGIVVLMENSDCRLQRYAKQLSQLRQPGEKIGSIIMNANPFTRGHQYLVRQAAAQCDWLHLFLVKEDNSRFPYEDRLQLVLDGTKDITNLKVHPGSEYMISRATFPCYFIKDQGVADDCYTEIDLKIFRQYLAPALGVTHRFVGTEPFCAVTAKYNHDMSFWLETPSLPYPAISLVEIERLKYHGTAISASWVRKLLVQGEGETLRKLVPTATYHYLQRLLAQRAPKAASAEKNVISAKSSALL